MSLAGYDRFPLAHRPFASERASVPGKETGGWNVRALFSLIGRAVESVFRVFRVSGRVVGPFDLARRPM